MKLKIKRDEDAESPRTFDNLGRMLCWHRQYKLGDEQPSEQPVDVIAALPKGSIVLPLYLYDHSGISMSTSDAYPFNDRWDAGQVGIIYVTPEAIRKEYSCKAITKKIRETAAAVLRGEVETYDAHLRGDVWGFVLRDDAGEEIDSCWGFYGGDKDGIMQHLPDEAKPLLEAAWEARYELERCGECGREKCG